MSKESGELKEKVKPPMGGLTAFSDFFELCERRNIDHVDVAFLRANNISSQGNETKVISGLKFLNLLNDDGSATEKMRSLNVQGELYKKNLSVIVHEAFDILFKTVKNIETANASDIINCFRVDYKMSPQTANEAFKIFVYLANRAGILLSSEVSSGLATTKEKKTTKTIQKENNEKKKQKVNDVKYNRKNEPLDNYLIIPEGMIRLEYQHKVLMFLPEGNKEVRAAAAKLARQFIETYENEAAG